MELTLVSVIIPAFNSAAHIAVTINSVLDQTYANIEIIVVDDGSTDTTVEVVGKFGDNVRYVYQDNSGPASARNTGIRNATGELIAFLDSDDEWLPTKLEKSISALRAAAAGMVCSNVLFYSVNANLIGYTFYSGITPLDIKERLLSHCFVILPTVVVKKCILEEVGLFNEQYIFGEDWDLFYRIARKYDVILIEDALTKVTQRKDSLTRDRQKMGRMVQDTVAIMNTVFSYPENIALEQKKKQFYNKYYRESADQELFHGNISGARSYLFKSLSYKAFDLHAYILLVKTCVWNLWPYARLRAYKNCH